MQPKQKPKNTFVAAQWLVVSVIYLLALLMAPIPPKLVLPAMIGGAVVLALTCWYVFRSEA